MIVKPESRRIHKPTFFQVLLL